MATLMHSLLTDEQRRAAAMADLDQLIAIARAEESMRRAHRAMLWSSSLGPQHFLNEMERARAGIDHTGKPVGVQQ